jgi:uncharacterized protein YbjT (DUF2867 family)
VRVLVAGVTGLIGASVAAALQRDGHAVTGITRREIHRPLYEVSTLDMRTAREADWLPLLSGIDAVVNCIGVLQDNYADSTHAAHVAGPGALFAACETAGVRKVIHFSAIGMDRETPTEFSRSKARGDSALMASTLDWVILRPSVVVGESAYGGSALFRGLAASPLLPRFPLAGQIQIVQLPDVVSTVLFFLREAAPTRITLELAGPDRLSLEDVVDEYRTWMGQRPARRLQLPQWVMRAVYLVGDFAGWLGWRPPIRSTAAAEMRRGATGDPAPWTGLTGIKPTALRDALSSSPASVQERWFSRLYLLKPAIFTIFSLFWIATAFMSLGPGWDIGVGLMHEGGVTGIAAPLTVVAGALADLAIGFGIAWRKTTRRALYAAFFLSLAYVVIGTLLVPRLWIDPLGPMLKIWPVLALNMTAIAILEDR